MLEERDITLAEAAPLLLRCGLFPDGPVDATVGLFDGDELAATGSLCGGMLQMMAVAPERQGEDLTARLVTRLLELARAAGHTTLHLFTRPDKTVLFTPLGFVVAAIARPHAALLEWGRPNVLDFCDGLRQAAGADAGPCAALVMNCNPFTLGHRHLIGEAAARYERVVVLAVREDRSEFPFEARLRLLREGVADLPGVVVLSGGRYAVSALTFPSYFTKREALADAHCAIDAELFAQRLAPALGAVCRYVGAEPFSPVTARYNRALKERLPPAGIEVRELPRLEHHGEPISASRVRALFAQGRMDELAPLVPPATLAYLSSAEARSLPAFCSPCCG